jgi:hypothetical protein
MTFLILMLFVVAVVGVPLVLIYRSMAREPEEEWTLIATAKTEAEAAVWAGALDAAGIRNSVHVRHASIVYPSLNEFELVVPSTEAESARRTLAFEG